MNAIADALPDAPTIDDLKDGVAQRLGHPVPAGVLRTRFDIFTMSLTTHRQDKTRAHRSPRGWSPGHRGRRDRCRPAAVYEVAANRLASRKSRNEGRLWNS
ncbi:hypothetical protein [Streptomyces griseoluteus]|uniref:hypothetical protein n=1 Tax=Streptomyces griseoluteus TaxID=29306 RepID=UPI0036A6933D